MLFELFERGDHRWLVVPAVTRAPARLIHEGPMARIGTASLHFNRLTDELASAISRHGYGVAQPEDEVRFRDVLRQDRPSSRPADLPAPTETGPKPRFH